MVKNTGEEIRTSAVKPLNVPDLIQVEEDASGLPVALRTKSRQRIVAIEDRWRLDDEWWRREPVSRLYYAVRLASGQRLVFYKDLINRCWYRQAL